MCERNEESHLVTSEMLIFKDSANLLINHRLILGMHRLMGIDGWTAWMDGADGRMDGWMALMG